MIPIEKLQAFMRLLHAVQNTERVARIPNEENFRSTAEHTFELTLLCWYINDVNKLGLNNEKILKYALAHDLIEGYAGDSFINDPEAQKTKVEREAAALKRIEAEFSEFDDMLAHIHAYEARENEESKFVYAVDKIIDPLNSVMETRESIWAKMQMSYKQVRDYKDAKVATSEHVAPYWEDIVKELEERKDFFFPGKLGE